MEFTKLEPDSSGFVTREKDVKKHLEVHIEQEETDAQPATLPPEYTNFTHGASEFNIGGNYIGQAALGNTGPVEFNQEWKSYAKGARHDTVEIKGGNFPQANIGGAATYNNVGGNLGGKTQKGLRPEKLTISILEKGVTCQELIKLLEKNYSLAQIAISIPDNATLRDRMIKALLLD